MYRIKVAKILLFFCASIYTLPVFFYSDQVIWEFKVFIGGILSLFVCYGLFFPSRSNSLPFLSNVNFNFKFSTYLLALVAMYLLIFISTYQNFTGFFNRSTRNSEFLQGNLYVVIDVLIKVFFICIISFSNTSKKHLVITLVLFAIGFDYAYLGARRTSTFIVLVYIWGLLGNLSKSQFILSILFLSIFGIFGFLFSGYRELIYSDIPVNSVQDVLMASIFTNEFQIVSLNLLEYMRFTSSNGFMPFEIFISCVAVLIPRFVWSSKPITIDKKLDIFPNIFGELYLNFGILSLFLLLIIIFLILREINRNSLIGIVLFASIPDLFRTTVDQFLLILTLYVVFFKLLNVKFKL
jgi:hypothetical protein